MRKILLDLEISGDIDDAVVLLYSLSNKLNIHAITLLNPTPNELSFVKNILDKYSYQKGLFVHYDKSIKNSNSTLKIISDYKYHGNRTHESLDLIKDSKDYIVLGGGAYTIPKILHEKGFNKFVLQGGFAGSKIVKKPLRKFIDKEYCSSWNPNLDITATKYMLKNCKDLVFISKDICHDSLIDINDLTLNSDTNAFIKKYLNGSNKKKAMHDLVALFYILDNNLCETLKVEMKEKNGKWTSTYQEFMPTGISISWNRNLFLKMLNS